MACLDTLKHGRVEDVDTGVDLVTDKLLWLLDEAVDSARSRKLEDDTKAGGLVDLGHHDGTLAAVRQVEVAQLLEGVRAGNVRVENEEGRRVLAENFSSKSKRSSCRTHSLSSVLFLGSSCCDVGSELSWNCLPVPRGSVSTENVILMSYFSSHLLRRATMISGRLKKR